LLTFFIISLYNSIAMKTLGEILRNERIAKKVELEEIASVTHIGLAFLKAMEENRFDMIPGPFYLRYYLKGYLQAVGIDERSFFQANRQLIDSLVRENEDETRETIKKVKYEHDQRHRFLFAFSLIILFVLLALYLFFGKQLLPFAGSKDLEYSIRQVGSDFYLDQEERFSLDRIALEARLFFTEECWLRAWRGQEEILERIFKPGNELVLRGYEITLHIGNPKGLSYSLNQGPRISFSPDQRPLKLVLTPERVKEIE